MVERERGEMGGRGEKWDGEGRNGRERGEMGGRGEKWEGEKGRG